MDEGMTTRGLFPRKILNRKSVIEHFIHNSLKELCQMMTHQISGIYAWLVSATSGLTWFLVSIVCPHLTFKDLLKKS
jgi:hypothetical protein